MNVRDAATMLELYVFSMPSPKREISGAYAGDLLSHVMSHIKAGNVWATVMNNMNVIAVSALCDVGMTILCDGRVPSEEMTREAEIRGVNIFGTKLSVYDICARLSNLYK